MKPSSHPLADLDFDTAWRRVKWDLHNRTFVTFAHEVTLVDFASSEWLARIKSDFESGTYTPRPCDICEVPKPGYLIRPGSRLDLADHVVYTVLVQEMFEPIRRRIETLRARKDYSYLLTGIGGVPWFQQPTFRGWSAFRKTCLERIDDGADTVIFADISGYYENVDLGRLRHILKSLDVSDQLLDPLFQCLRVWAEPRGRGIPQGISASDLLAKIHLDGVDRRLERSGLDHVRYVDDFRLFCAGTLDAKKAIKTLSAFLRAIGLNLALNRPGFDGDSNH